MFIVAAAILLLVIGLTAWAMYAPERWRRALAARRTVLIGGLIFPIVTLTILLVVGLGMERTIVTDARRAKMTIKVTGERWWWRVEYLDANGQVQLATANEIHVPVGQPVKFVVESPNVIHSFWVPSLGGKIDMIPGRTNSIVLQADKAATYRGQCAEYCGGQHALMAFEVVAEPMQAFQSWLAAQKQGARAPATDNLRQGRELFLSYGCGACHVVRGTQASGTIGPDLTHVGSRRMIAAATLPNDTGSLAGWIGGAQHIKRGSPMPSFNVFQDEELLALASYLESLK